MILLAFETATEACSIALLHGDALIERFEIAPRRHAELVLPMTEALLAEAGLARSQIDGIAFGRGPGAFTGVRLAVSLAQGLGLALDCPLYPVSTLAALAEPAAQQDGAVLALIDARMGEVYAVAFDSVNGELRQIGEEQVLAPQSLALPRRSRWTVRGSGWATYSEALRSVLGDASFEADGDALPHASSIARLAASMHARGEGVAPEFAQPVYLRNKVAQTLVEQGKPLPESL
jgi:tRNA threonylcarbamoyladenosine biosynthesis protein TsaB